MATVSKGSIADGFKGTLGGLVFRQVNGKTIVTQKVSRSTGNTPFQQFRRKQFREATEWAKKITRTSREKKEHYARLAKEQGLPNAYTAAIKEYMAKIKHELKMEREAQRAINLVNMEAINEANNQTEKQLK